MAGSLKPLFTWRSAVASEGGPPRSTTRHVLLTLSLHMNEKGGSCFPSTRTLAEETGLSRRSVETHINLAVADGWLRKRLIGLKGQRWRRSEYEATLPTRWGTTFPTSEKGGVTDDEGGEPRDQKVGNDVPTSSSVSSSRSSSEDFVEKPNCPVCGSAKEHHDRATCERCLAESYER